MVELTLGKIIIWLAAAFAVLVVFFVLGAGGLAIGHWLEAASQPKESKAKSRASL